MTFDLVFYRRESDPDFDIGELIAMISSSPNFKVRQLKEGYDLFYENKLTGVYFMMGYSPGDEAPLFPGFKGCGLFIHINYARPTYFALETIPIVSEIAKHLSLFVLDDQISSPARTPSTADPNALQESWAKSNKWAVEAAWKHAEPIYFLPRERLDYAWNYLAHANSLQERTEVFVPTKLFAFRDKVGGVQTCCPWPNYMPQVFPLVDLVLIGDTSAAQGQKARGFAKFSKVREMLSGIIGEVNEPLEYLLLSKELSDKTRQNLDRIPLSPLGNFAGVPWDQIVDVAPPQSSIVS